MKDNNFYKKNSVSFEDPAKVRGGGAPCLDPISFIFHAALIKNLAK